MPECKRRYGKKETAYIRLFGDGLHCPLSFFDHPEGDYLNRGIAQHPDVMNHSRGDMEGLSCGYSLRLTTFDMQLKSPLTNNGVVISRVFVVRQRNSRSKFAGRYNHLLRIVSR